MNGKILKILSNDLYGNVDDRYVAVFAAFNHIRYMNKYVIFAFDGEFSKNKLCYGSLHLKDNSLVVFAVNDATRKFIDAFVDNYVNSYVDPKEYSLIDISKMEKIELVSYSERDFDRLTDLDRLSIKRVVPTDENSSSGKRVFLYFLLFIMLGLLGGITYLYLYPEKFTVEYNMLECQAEKFNQDINMNYVSNRVFKFNKEDNIKTYTFVDTYTFDNSNDYFEFKDNKRESELFNGDADFEYNDDDLTLKITYDEELVVYNLIELKSYMKSEGYKCQEGTYYE